MLIVKSESEIEILRKNNILVSKTLGELAKIIKPGVSTLKLDKIAEEFIRDNGAIPGFLGFGGFPNSLCTSVNDEVVHGIPSKYELKDGDIISIDCGTILDGYYGDSAYTFQVGNVKPEYLKLLKVTKESLQKGIENAIVGMRVGDIGYAVQKHAENNNYSVVRELVGHGLGKEMHEAPEIPNYGRKGRGLKLKNGLVICIEPMINFGEKYIKQDKDGWTIRTNDGKPSAHFEKAVVIRNDRAEALTTYKYIEEVLNNKN
ncbi:MAG: type I methionyl aminopeptidase [Bacteroidales bacterium]|jgi:methionyl aminopeptidase|nr:type I methionyl aminopeptidase [Bacteroidales bacterium]